MRRLTISLILTVLFLLMISPAQTQDENVPFRIGRGDVEAVQWHPKGLYVMVSSVTGAWIYTDTLEDVTHISDLQLADITPDGKYITGTVDGQTIQFWDASTFEFVKDYKTDVRQIAALAWSPDSRYLAVGNHGDDLFQILDFEYDPQRTSNPNIYLSNIHADKLAWSADGNYLATMNIETAEVRVWDHIQRQFTIYDKPEYGEGGMSLMWDRCNFLIRQQYSENPISTIWNMNNGDVIEKKYLGWNTAFSPTDCSHYSAGYINNLTTYDAKEIEADFLPYNVTAAAWKPDGKQIAISEWAYQSEPRSLWIVDAVTAQVIQEIPTQDKSMREIVWHPWLSYFITMRRDNQLTAYYLDNSDTSYTITGTQDAHAQVSDVFEWNPVNSEMAIANQVDGANIWDVQAEKNSANYRYNGKTITNLDWSADGELLAIMVSDGTGYHTVGEKVVVLDKRSEHLQYVDVLPDTAASVDFDWHPAESQLAIATNGNVSIWDQDQQYIVQNIPRDGTAVPGIEWSPDGESLAVPAFYSGGGSSAALIHVESGESTSGVSTYHTAWTWTPDNETVWFSWGFYGCGGVSTPIVEPEVRSNWEQSAPLIGMTKQVTRGFVSPNGTYGVALDEDGNGLIWDIRTADVLAMLSDVKNLAWAEDESKFAIQRMDNALMILSPTGQVLEYIAPNVSFAPRNRYAGQFGKLKWSADGTYLAHSHDGVIDVWTPSKVTPSKSETNTTTPAMDLSDMERVILSVLIVISAMMGLKLIHNLHSQRSFGKRKRD